MVCGKNILILGLGNDILTDDGIGPRLVADLSRMITQPDLTFKTACSGGLAIVEQISGYRMAVIIDAIHTNEGVPGKLYFLSPDDFMETSNLSVIHDVNFLTALKLGKELGLEPPAVIKIIAVEIAEDREFSERFTPVMESKYPEILDEVYSRIRMLTM